jgi:hypothetical protein
LESNTGKGLGYIQQVLFSQKLGNAVGAVAKTIALKIRILNSLLAGNGALKTVGKHLAM